MKKMIVFCISLMVLNAQADSDEPKTSPTGYRPAYFVVKKESLKKLPDGTYDSKDEIICESEIKVPTFRISVDPKKKVYPSFSVNHKVCEFRIKDIDAKIVLAPFITEFDFKKMSNQELRQSIGGSKVPQWLVNQLRQTGSKGQIFISSVYIVPKSTLVGVDGVNNGPESYDDYSKISKLFEDIFPTESISHFGDSNGAIYLSTTSSISNTYCQEEVTDDLCSSEFKITTGIVFKGQ